MLVEKLLQYYIIKGVRKPLMGPVTVVILLEVWVLVLGYH